MQFEIDGRYVFLLQFSLPRPQGGKHANNPVLCEDQREAQKRQSKLSKKKVDVFDVDFVANSSPFAPTDIYSRAATHGYIGRNTGVWQHRRNPNENHKYYGHRK
jgi:RNA-binding protein NOB1